MADAISYTAATGKRPQFGLQTYRWCWHAYPNNAYDYEYFVIPDPIYFRMGVRPEFETELAAINAVNVAYLRAVADGAMGPIGDGVA